ncbi:MAG: hypothetical protein JEY96_15535 [Bacteroidales bacterium]|nr:hypothetical protein [Bacteroidales bacterium]
MIKKEFIFVVLISIILVSCNTRNRVNIDLSDINVDAEIKRLDQDVFQIDLDSTQKDVNVLVNKYSEFFELYNSMIIKLGNPYSKSYPELLKGFVTDYTMNKIYTKTTEVYPNLNDLETELEEAFKRFKYYFPEKNTPAFYTYIGGFNQSIVVTDSMLGIGLDKYLGSNCIFYKRLGIANYLQQNMIPEMISIDAVKSWALTEFDYNDSIDNVVNNMIYQGKIQYFLNATFPNKADSLKFGFSGDDVRWCIKNEKQMWNYLIDQKLLFSTDYMVINKLINPAPFTTGFPNESPGRASVWLGEKIVSAYMNRFPNLTIKELMLDDNYQKILSESRYEP